MALPGGAGFVRGSIGLGVVLGISLGGGEGVSGPDAALVPTCTWTTVLGGEKLPASSRCTACRSWVPGGTALITQVHAEPTTVVEQTGTLSR